jgi:hypothetical protein
MNDRLPDSLLSALTQTIDVSRERLYNINLNQRPVRDAYKSIDFLVDSLCLLEECASQSDVKDLHDQEYYFLKKVLEKNAPLFHSEELIFTPLGIQRERSQISKPNQKEIAAQISAQILWALGDCSTIREAILCLQEESTKVSRFFNLSKFLPKKLRDWISPVYPVPLEIRNKPAARRLVSLMGLKSIPSVFSEQGINFQKLCFATQVATSILKERKWSQNRILASQFIRLLEASLPESLRVYVRHWVEESFLSGRIFDATLNEF